MGDFSANDLLDEYLKEEEAMRQEIHNLKIKLATKRETIQDIARKVGRTVYFPSIDEDEKKSEVPIEIRPDAFFNKSHPDAAAEYLDMVGHAMPIDDILAALKKGGATFKGSDQRGSLYTQLIRGTKRFAKIGDTATFGLIKWYGNMRKSGGKTKAEKEQSANEENERTADEDEAPEGSEESNSEISGEE